MGCQGRIALRHARTRAYCPFRIVCVQLPVDGYQWSHDWSVENTRWNVLLHRPKPTYQLRSSPSAGLLPPTYTPRFYQQLPAGKATVRTVRLQVARGGTAFTAL